MNKPNTLYAVVCENGTLAHPESGRMPIYLNDFHAEEAVEETLTNGLCPCDEHRMVKYTPSVVKL